MGNGYTTTLPLDVFTQRNFVADIIRLKSSFIFISLFKPPFWALTNNVRIQSIVRWKADGDFLFVNRHMPN